MSGRVGLDFGTSNTVVAMWREELGEGEPVRLDEVGTMSAPTAHGGVPVVPSLVAFEGDRVWVGQQVIERNLHHHPEHTFRWMKRYISMRNEARRQVGDRMLSAADAGDAFLEVVLGAVRSELVTDDEEIALTVPVEGFEHYAKWLGDAADRAGLPRFRLIDEPSAAALGYGTHIQPGDVYAVFDFGGGTLDVAIVVVQDDDRSAAGRMCRVLGKRGASIGGASIDGWIFKEVLQRGGIGDHDEVARRLSASLLVESEAAKIRLSTQPTADITVLDPDSGEVIAAKLTREELEELLDRHDAFHMIDKAISGALTEAHERGYSEDQIKSVLMLGGTSLMPSVQKSVHHRFGRDRVQLARPLDAVARGAAAFVAGVDFYDYVQHEYAIRYVDTEKGTYAFRTLVNHGTSYPTKEPVARLIVKGTYDGQKELGLDIFEVSRAANSVSDGAYEIVFGLDGAARLAQVTGNEETRRREFWMNERSPTFLKASPPAREGEAVYEVTFSVDGNKRLTLTAFELRTKEQTHRDFPVVTLM